MTTDLQCEEVDLVVFGHCWTSFSVSLREREGERGREREREGERAREGERERGREKEREETKLAHKTMKN